MIRSFINTSVAALLCLGLASCSLFQKNVPTEALLPADRHTVATDDTRQDFRSSSIESGNIGGDWLIENVLGDKASGQDTPFLRFDPRSKMVYGSNGCNAINAAYMNNPADSTISFSEMAVTLRLCPDGDQSERAINTAIAQTKRYTWSRSDGRYHLTLYDAAMKPVMELVRQNFDFLNGAWSVSSIEGVPIKNENMKLVFDVDEMKVHGNTGCNILNGSIVTDMALSGSISFQNMATTRRTCPDINLETAMLVALEAATQVRPVDNNSVEFLNTHGDVVLTLTRQKIE